MAGFRDYPNLVSVAATPDDFVSLLGLAPSESPDLPNHRQQAARQHTWDKRIEAVEALLTGNEAAYVE